MNRLIKYIVLGIYLLTWAATLQAQRTVLARPDDTAVWVRWTLPDLKNKNGINVYRQNAEGGEWVLLNEKPFTYGQVDLSAAIASNKELKRAKDMADGMRKEGKLEGIGLALVLTKAVQSREFSNYLGIIYEDKTAEKGKEYRYEVREVASTGEITYGQSEIVKAGKFVEQTAPIEIKTKEGDESLFFSWKPEENRLTGANIYYKLGGGAWQQLNKKIILPSKIPQDKGEDAYPEWLFIADSLLNGTTYTCVIKGVDFFGFETEASKEFKLTPQDKTPPAQVLNFDLAIDIDKVALTWELPKAKGIDGINIYRQKGLDTNWVKLTKQPLPATAKRFDEVVDEVPMAYVYVVATVDKAGNENRTDGRTADVRDLKPPVQVRNLKAVADTGVIKLSWFPNPEKDLKGYLIYRMAKTKLGADTILVNTNAIVANSYNDTLPKVAKNQFVYFVKAIDTNYNLGPISAAATAVMPDPEPPQRPTIKGIRKEVDGIKVVWLPGMELDLAGYNVYRSVSEEGEDSIWHLLTPRLLSAKDTAYGDQSIEAGQSYFYRIEAVDDAGNKSEKSLPFMASVTTMKFKILAQDIQIKHGKGKPEATISWSVPKNNEMIGCMVYRKQGKDAFLPISGLVNQFEIKDTGLQKGETYYYEIRVFDKVGNYSKSAPAVLKVEAD